MALKLFIAACLLAVASAQYGGYAVAPKYPAAPKYAAPKYAAPSYGYAQPEPYDPNPQYQFEYSVNDPSTYDVKSQQEERNGDYVKGSYQLYEPDGTNRVVNYYDDGYGFQATVTKTPAQGYAAPAYAAPAYAAPKYPAYSAPRRPAYPRPSY